MPQLTAVQSFRRTHDVALSRQTDPKTDPDTHNLQSPPCGALSAALDRSLDRYGHPFRPQPRLLKVGCPVLYVRFCMEGARSASECYFARPHDHDPMTTCRSIAIPQLAAGRKSSAVPFFDSKSNVRQGRPDLRASANPALTHMFCLRNACNRPAQNTAIGRFIDRQSDDTQIGNWTVH
jgi:hypothetical protein